MSKTPLVLHTLHVDRLYGRTHDALRLDGLAPGINVVHGPNGQGKTTVGRGLHALVWPASVAQHRPVLSGAFQLGDEAWRVDLDGPTVRHQRGGVDAPAPPLADADERARYRLSLHDLLRSDGDDFASIIARDVAGGLDVDKAIAELKFSASTPRSSTATKTAQAARETLGDLVRAQKQLAADAQALDGLERLKKEASLAAGLRDLWDAAREHAAIRDEAAAALHALQALPPALAQTRDEDAATLATLRNRARDAAGRALAAQRDGEAAGALLASNAVAQAAQDAPLVALATVRDAVRDADHRLETRSSELAGLRTHEAAAAARLPAADLDRLFAVTLADVADLEGHARDAARLMAARETLAAHTRGETDLPQTRDRETLAQAAALLRGWLRAERSALPPSVQRLALAGALVCALAAAAVGLIVHPAGFALLLGAALLAALAIQLRTALSGPSDDTPSRFERLSVGSVESPWSRDAVEARLDAVETEHAQAVLGAEIRTYTAARRDVLPDLREWQARVDAQGADVAARLGLDRPADSADLAHVVQTVREYQEVRGRRVNLEAVLASARASRVETLARASALVAPFGLPPVDSHEALASVLATLTDAHATAAEARTEHKGAEQRAAYATREADAARAEIEALFGRLGLDPEGGDAAVADACRQRSAYLAAEKTSSDASAQADALLRRLRAFPARTADHESATAAEAAEHRDRAAGLAAQTDDLTAQITELRTRIGQAEAAHAVETAAANYDVALGALQTECDKTVASRLGALFAETAARTSRELQVPDVVRRAGDILSAITAHRYGLEFDTAAAGFVATDRVLGHGLHLNELSSGTRVQLLLSVRIAFIEQRERGVRLPLVLDELLANSDEDRADAITQAVLALCRDGRQVVYLTSQPDEVAKWRRVAADNADVECAFFALGDAGGDGAADPDARPHVSLARPVPAPDALDHAAYGALLDVPDWSARDDVGSLHLWYALDDPQALHSALAAGVTRLGPALSAVEAGAAGALGLAHPERLAVFADALAGWRAAWQVGRGRHVYRETIEASRAISFTFVDRVSELAGRLGGDGRALLAALRNKELDHFRQSNAEALEVYLLNMGYLDSDDPLGEDELWARVVERVGPACTDGTPSLQQVRAFLGRVAAGAPQAPEHAGS